MYAFQFITFILQLLFWLFIAATFIFLPGMFFNADSSYKTDNIFSMADAHKKSKLADRLNRAFGCVIAIVIIIFFALPYILDLPKLFTRNFSHAIGYVSDVRTEQKDPNEYVYIQGKKLKFFFSSNIKKHEAYEIRYLPHTSRAIFGNKLDGGTSSVDKKIQFPLKDFILFIGILAAFLLLIFLTPYLRLKLLILSCMIYYPANLYFYIHYGISSGIWFSTSNKGLFFILAGMAMLLLLVVLYFLEKLKDYETPFTLFAVQLLSIAQILILFGEELHLIT